MHCIRSSGFCLPLLLNRGSVELPLAVPQSLEQLHMFPISDRDGRTGCSRLWLCCRLLSTFGCVFGWLETVGAISFLGIYFCSGMSRVKYNLSPKGVT